ncbi:hypothetical protein BGX33_007428 [Mortierella sp. NVP41]|nr:hypothetical protein BGX33_007428 [Mortierella sp. NVP41]
MNTSLFDALPYEVQEIVISFLRLHDLSTCVRVCQLWKTTFNPFLWKHIEEPRSSSGEYLELEWLDRFLACAAEGALRTNGHLIRSIYLPYHDMHTLSDFLKHCPPTFAQLTSATFGGMKGSDEEIADFIDRTSAGWEELCFYQFYDPLARFEFGQLTVQAVLKHASTLRNLVLEEASDFDSKAIQQLLCSAPNLESLDLLASFNRMEGEVGGAVLDALDMVGYDWVCRNLHEFSCQIGNIPRPDITRNIDNGPACVYLVEGTHQESIDLQRRVYSQLARLPKLTRLTLNAAIDYASDFKRIHNEWYRSYTCPSMSLESGLDLLKDLKELRVVNLEDMEVSINNDAEKKWVAEHWPKAKIVYTAPATDLVDTDEEYY